MLTGWSRRLVTATRKSRRLTPAGQDTGGQPKKRRRSLEARRRAIRARFLLQFRELGSIVGACRASKVARSSVYEWLNDPAFKVAFDQAEEEGIEQLEQEARRRALFGIDKPIYHNGLRVDTVKEYSDTLLIFLLKGKRPQVYRERFEHTGKGGGPIQLQAVPDADLDQRITELAQQLHDAAPKRLQE